MSLPKWIPPTVWGESLAAPPSHSWKVSSSESPKAGEVPRQTKPDHRKVLPGLRSCTQGLVPGKKSLDFPQIREGQAKAKSYEACAPARRKSSVFSPCDFRKAFSVHPAIPVKPARSDSS